MTRAVQLIRRINLNSPTNHDTPLSMMMMIWLLLTTHHRLTDQAQKMWKLKCMSPTTSRHRL